MRRHDVCPCVLDHISCNLASPARGSFNRPASYRELEPPMRMIAIACVVTLLSGTTASALELCAQQKHDGSFDSGLNVRQSCKPNEVRVDPTALGLQGPPGPQGPPGWERPCPPDSAAVG